VSLAPARTNTWNRDADGTWSDPNNWNLGRVPQAGEDVLINRPNGLFNVTYSTGDLSIRSLVNEENMVLSGGTLAATQPSFWNETLRIAGGTLTGPGDKTIKNLILLTGAIRGSGNVTVNDAFTQQTAGVIDIGGVLTIRQTTGALTIAAPLSASSMSLLATDPSGSGTIGVNGPLSSTGNIAFVSSGGIDLRANVSAGEVIHVESGGNISVSGARVAARRIELAFPSRSFDFVVNATQAVVTSGTAGFFSGGVPAVLGTTLDVTYGSGDAPTPVSDPIVVQASNVLIEATQRVFDPFDLLGTDGNGDGTSQFKVQGGGGAAILDPSEAARDAEALKECR